MVPKKLGQLSDVGVPVHYVLHRWVVTTLVYGNGRCYQFLRFLMVGCLNTAFGQAVFVVLVLCGLNDVIALFLATVLGVLFNYLTARRIVFRSGPARWTKFIGCYAVLFGVNASLLRLGTQFMSPIAAQLLLALPMALLTFTFMRGYVFASQNEIA